MQDQKQDQKQDQILNRELLTGFLEYLKERRKDNPEIPFEIFSVFKQAVVEAVKAGTATVFVLPNGWVTTGEYLKSIPAAAVPAITILRHAVETGDAILGLSFARDLVGVWEEAATGTENFHDAARAVFAVSPSIKMLENAIKVVCADEELSDKNCKKILLAMKAAYATAYLASNTVEICYLTNTDELFVKPRYDNLPSVLTAARVSRSMVTDKNYTRAFIRATQIARRLATALKSWREDEKERFANFDENG